MKFAKRVVGLSTITCIWVGCQQDTPGRNDSDDGVRIGSASAALAPSESGLFELDKNATDNLKTELLGTLLSTVNAAATSMVVCRTFSPEPPVPFTIEMDAEQIQVTAAGPSSASGSCPTKRAYTVSRGFNSTTAAGHAGGANVTLMNFVTVPGIDWDQVFNHVVNGIPLTGPVLPVATSFVADPVNGTIFTTGGSKDDLDIPSWRYTDGSVPDADEIADAYAAKFIDPNNQHQFLFFGADRLAQNGSKDFGFWFLHQPVSLVKPGTTFDGKHTVPAAGQSGDILILGTFTQGGAATNIRVFEWVGTGGTATANGTVSPHNGNFGDCVSPLIPNPATDGCGTVNNTSIPVLWDYQAKGANAAKFIPAGGFFEGGVDLTALGLQGCFASFVAETRSSPSVDATLKDFVLGQFEACGSSNVTIPRNGTGGSLGDDDHDGIPDLSIGTGAATVKDSATVTVSGISTWSGTLNFYLCGPMATGNCTTGGTPVSSKVVSQASLPEDFLSGPAQVTSVGRYCWRSEFISNTAGVPNSRDPDPNGPHPNSVSECFEVLPVIPSLDTQAVASPVNLGQPVQDNATLSGTARQPGSPIITAPPDSNALGALAGGTIQFTLVKADCTTRATGTPAGGNPQSVTVNGNGTYGPVSFTPDAPGTYHWKAQYFPAAGDPNNVADPQANPPGITHNANCTDPDETVVVNQPTTLTTRQFVFPQDKAQITASGGGNVAGSVSFKLYDTLANCQANGAAGLLYSPASIAISGVSPQVATTNNTTVRVDSNTTVFWRVQFISSNPAQLGSLSNCVESTSVSFAGNDGNISLP